MEFPSEEWKELYAVANHIAAKVGAEGEVEFNSHSPVISRLMDALWELDGGMPEA
jgi:hypothetical protein